MSDFLISLVSVVAVLGFMILIHEFGHYAVAKWLGVRVEQFAIGFGKRLVGFRKGDTDYRINAIPLGGYVKMSGENPMDQRTDDPKEFLNHSRWHRFFIAIAGPTMNILLAIVLLTVVYMVHYEYPIYLDKAAVVQGVRKDSPAQQAGIQAGDRIIKIDGIDNPTWEQVQPRVWLSPNQPLQVTIRRGDQIFIRLDGESLLGVAQFMTRDLGNRRALDGHRLVQDDHAREGLATGYFRTPRSNWMLAALRRVLRMRAMFRRMRRARLASSRMSSHSF